MSVWDSSTVYALLYTVRFPHRNSLSHTADYQTYSGSKPSQYRVLRHLQFYRGQNGSACFPVRAIVLFMPILNYRSDADPKYVGSTLAGNDMMRAAFGGAFPLFAPAMFHRLGWLWARSLLGSWPLLLFSFL
jgi:hypothetical protein